MRMQLLRMANWTSLVHVAVKAEVPDYEIMQTMSLFFGELDLDEGPVKRLAKFFGFSTVTLLKNDGFPPLLVSPDNE